MVIDTDKANCMQPMQLRPSFAAEPNDSLKGRCAPSYPSCLCWCGGTPEIAADFVQGRGWWKSQDLVSGCWETCKKLQPRLSQCVMRCPCHRLCSSTVTLSKRVTEVSRARRVDASGRESGSTSPRRYTYVFSLRKPLES